MQDRQGRNEQLQEEMNQLKSDRRRQVRVRGSEKETSGSRTAGSTSGSVERGGEAQKSGDSPRSRSGRRKSTTAGSKTGTKKSGDDGQPAKTPGSGTEQPANEGSASREKSE